MTRTTWQELSVRREVRCGKNEESIPLIPALIKYWKTSWAFACGVFIFRWRYREAKVDMGLLAVFALRDFAAAGR